MQIITISECEEGLNTLSDLEAHKRLQSFYNPNTGLYSLTVLCTNGDLWTDTEKPFSEVRFYAEWIESSEFETELTKQGFAEVRFKGVRYHFYTKEGFKSKMQQTFHSGGRSSNNFYNYSGINYLDIVPKNSSKGSNMFLKALHFVGENKALVGLSTVITIGGPVVSLFTSSSLYATSKGVIGKMLAKLSTKATDNFSIDVFDKIVTYHPISKIDIPVNPAFLKKIVTNYPTSNDYNFSTDLIQKIVLKSPTKVEIILEKSSIAINSALPTTSDSYTHFFNVCDSVYNILPNVLGIMG